MSQGSPGSQEPSGPETIRRAPTDPGESECENAPILTRFADLSDLHPTEAHTPSAGQAASFDPYQTDVQTPSSNPGTGGSIVENGVVEIQVGRTVFGKYLVQKQLGRGGMGEVWLVKDVELDVERALKVISQGTAFNADARARFRREARAMARFSHPNVVTVHDSRLDLRDVAYIVMEYVPGESLEKVIRSGQPMPLDWVFRVLSQLCDALQEAHSRGIIHRDLKPSNLMMVVTSSGRQVLKVLDFGIAKILGPEETQNDIQTVAGAFMGTPPYASPEQAGGRSEPLSDIYSVGVILYEFLTGHRPFRGKPAAMIYSTIATLPPAFAEVNSLTNVPPEIERVVLRCLEKDPDRRPPSPLALLEEFEAAMPGKAAPSRVPIAKIEEVESVPISTKQKDRRWIVPVALVLGLFGFVLAVVLVLKRSREDIPRPSVDGSQKVNDVESSKVLKVEIELAGRKYYLWEKRAYLPVGYQPGDASDLDGDYPRTLVNKDDVRFIRIPAGRFQMGALGKPGQGESDADDTNIPTRSVAMRGFYIQKFEVTNGEFDDYFRKTPEKPTDPYAEEWRKHFDQVSATANSTIASKHPVRQVSWKLANDFAKVQGGWLPTEAQWEYAARSGKTARALVWDEETTRDKKIERLANLDRSSRDGILTQKVGDYPDDQTLQFVMDMAGNVREWCRDPWVPYQSLPEAGPTPLPDDPSPETEIVVRGGSYNTDTLARFVTRRGTPLQISDMPTKDVGFRMVIECPELAAGR